MGRDDQPLIAIVGATATGKTAAGIAVGTALGGEIVGADSRQVYRGMGIGTAQPSPSELAAVPHHLVATIEPNEPFGLALYLDLARAAILDIQTRGKLPIVVGGTGQYVWALLEGWSVPRVTPDWELRMELEAVACQRGAAALHDRLQDVDPAAASVIHPHNVRRVIRALEVHRHTGEPFSVQQLRKPVSARILGLRLPNLTLYERIDRRVEAMYAAGLLDEVERLGVAGYGRDLPSMASIGYPEAWATLRSELTVDDAICRTQFATHRLARKQRTWFRSADERISWIDASLDQCSERIVDLVNASPAFARNPEGDFGAVCQDARHGQ